MARLRKVAEKGYKRKYKQFIRETPEAENPLASEVREMFEAFDTPKVFIFCCKTCSRAWRLEKDHPPINKYVNLRTHAVSHKLADAAEAGAL